MQDHQCLRHYSLNLLICIGLLISKADTRVRLKSVSKQFKGAFVSSYLNFGFEVLLEALSNDYKLRISTEYLKIPAIPCGT